MSFKRYDVIVVGAGPAGATAARLLAEDNLSVLLLEKETLPRDKPCGGGLTGGAVKLIPDLDLTPVVQKCVTETIFCYRGEEPVLTKHPQAPVLMTMRGELDHLLARKASAAGAELLTNARALAVEKEDDHHTVLLADGRRFHAEVVVGADGAASRVAASLKMKRNSLLCPAVAGEVTWRGGTAHPNTERVIFEVGGVPMGYAWSFPKAGGASTGVATVKRDHRRLKADLDDFMAGHNVFEGAAVRYHGCPLPFYQKPSQLHAPGAVLLGDAGGLVDPLSGEGIQFALHSARLAAGPIAKTIRTGADHLAEYSRAVSDQIYPEFECAGKFAALFFRFPRACYKMGMKDPEVVGFFTDLVTGSRTYQEIYTLIKKKYARRFWSFVTFGR